jgi:hypothetical protein
MKRTLILIATVTVIGLPIATLACGACVEDRIAATYDYATINAAIAKHQQVVFVAVDGPISAKLIDTRIVAAASKVRGVQTGTLRTSLSPQAFSFVLDPEYEPKVAVAGFRKAVRDASVRLTLLRVVRDDALLEAPQ